MRYYNSYEDLQASLIWLNRDLAEMCGGEQLIEFPIHQDWIFDPSEHELEYEVLPGASEKALAAAKRAHDNYSFVKDLRKYPADRPCEQIYARTGRPNPIALC